ncbi:NAD-dependent epimerase/dehydratase family protein [Paenibacillus sp. GCM10027628]|uniref:NAD-dependent epimerase/dehydratase family protein n=1 Tax=Paenibacillus sp. GCM10027628 TaxID=3273413 RepID=UPI003633F7B1
MKILVAGASGAVGRSLLPLLVEAGHEVVGMTRNPAYVERLQSVGVQPVLVDVLDREAVFAALQETKPQTVIHQLTSLSVRNFADNARIRIEGTRNLVDAAQSVGVRRMIAQSISWAYVPGDGPATEEEALDLDAPAPRQQTVQGIQALEQTVADMPEYVILRYGLFYGPGTWYAPSGFMAEQVRNQGLPETDGISSFIHVDDAARAAYLALNWPTGPVNIVDNEPAHGTEWLPIYAAAIGAPKPQAQVPGQRWERGASNAKAREQYGWEPLYPSWRVGFRDVLG